MMSNRRDFIRSGIGLSGILLSGKAPAYVRSLLGGRNIRISDSKWANPYVTDGLLAMYDGEWNAGPFLHDSNMMPIDLTRKKFINLNFEGDIEIMEKSIHFLSQSYAIDRTLQNLNSYDAITIEYVSSVDNISSGESTSFGWIYYGTGYSPSRRICGIFNSGNGAINAFHLGTYDDYGYYTIQTKCHYYCVIANLLDGTAASKVYRDGNMLNVGVKRTTSNKNKNPTAAFALRILNSPSKKDSYMYSLRVYGRALTNEEIQHNYLIDKERFEI